MLANVLLTYDSVIHRNNVVLTSVMVKTVGKIFLYVQIRILSESGSLIYQYGSNWKPTTCLNESFNEIKRSNVTLSKAHRTSFGAKTLLDPDQFHFSDRFHMKRVTIQFVIRATYDQLPTLRNLEVRGKLKMINVFYGTGPTISNTY